MRRNAACLLIVFLLSLAFSAASAKEPTTDTGYDFCISEFMRAADASGRPQILYTGVTKSSLTMRSRPDKDSAGLGQLNEKAQVQIFGFDQTWLFCWSDTVGVYYLGRHNVDAITPVSAGVPSYGVIPNRFVARALVDTALYVERDKSSGVVFELPAGTRFSFWMIDGGWAIVPYRRLVGYVWLGDLYDLTPVSPSPDYAKEGDVISAFTSFYSTKTTELNVGRMENIRVGCGYISQTYQTGEEFNFNKIAGPYRMSRGYLPSPVLVDGETTAGYGGGTCQVSTTLYNALLQVPEGIEIVWRRPHGPSGASYAPHGVDAAVGATNLNLIFRNVFPFPITLDCTAMDGALCVLIRKGPATTMAAR